MTRRAVRAAAVGLAAALVAAALPSAAETGRSSVDIEAKPILKFQPGSDRTRFGDLEFVGGIAFWSSDSRVHSLSSIRFLDNSGRFLAVADTGFWFAGEIVRDAEGRPSGIEDASIAPILGSDGNPYARKGEADAEALAIRGDETIVGFEVDHRLAVYANAADPSMSRPRPLPLPIPKKELRINRGIETVAVAPPGGRLDGSVVVVAERSLDPAGNLLAAIVGGKSSGPFTVKRDDPWDVSDGAFLPGGDLLLLERRYSRLGGLGMRIRRVAGASIRPGALVDGPVLIEADLGEAIDNMEGIAVSRDADGAVHLILVSDDNGSIFQRNLILEFKLAKDEPAAGRTALTGPPSAR